MRTQAQWLEITTSAPPLLAAYLGDLGDLQQQHLELLDVEHQGRHHLAFPEDLGGGHDAGLAPPAAPAPAPTGGQRRVCRAAGPRCARGTTSRERSRQSRQAGRGASAWKVWGGGGRGGAARRRAGHRPRAGPPATLGLRAGATTKATGEGRPGYCHRDLNTTGLRTPPTHPRLLLAVHSARGTRGASAARLHWPPIA
jgi:hypothetical protein